MPVKWRLATESDPQQRWIVVTDDHEEELTGPVDEATADLVVEAFRRSRGEQDGVGCLLDRKGGDPAE